MKRVTIIGPVYPYRAGIAYCTTRLAEELAKSCEVSILSFSRQYPKSLYPGGGDIDESLRSQTPEHAQFSLDVMNPFTWLRAAWRLGRDKPDAVIVVWWIWVWALQYRVVLSLLPRSTRVILQCHNIGEKEPAAWKRWLSNLMLSRGDALLVHAESEREEAERRPHRGEIVKWFLPVHELGGAIPSREEARRRLGITAKNVALCFGHVRPFKGLDIALTAWRALKSDVLLLVAGEVWWKSEAEYRRLAAGLPNVRLDFRYIPDSEVADYFAACDVVLAPYRTEAQSGVALTAFHFQRPVIAARVGGLPEIIQDGVNGMLVPPEDPDTLALAVDAFFNGGAGMESGAQNAAAMYSWKEYGRVMLGLVKGA